jgi:putative endonuclease
LPGRQRRREALQRGVEAEERVSRQLSGSGWHIIERNWRCRGGEIDIIAIKDGRLRFVEVKGRGSQDVLGLEQIGATKQRRLRRAAKHFLQRTDEPFDEVCFAVAFVRFQDSVNPIEWIDDAFDG